MKRTLKFKQHYFAILFITVLLSINCFAQKKHTSFHPGADKWLDTGGVHVNAHGGGLLYDQKTYYWFGEHKISGNEGNRAMVGVQVYSSKDLYNWKNEGIALKVEEDVSSLLQVGCTLERPKVIYNDKTKKYVMWFHHELKDMGYHAALTGIAVADQATGPYKYIKSFRMNPLKWPKNFTKDEMKDAKQAFEDDSLNHQELGKRSAYLYRDFPGGQMSRDMTLFKDDDGTAYHITASESNQTLHITKLSDDYLSWTDEYTRVFPGGRNEAPAIFKMDGIYYMMSSGLTGWAPNPARSAMSNNMFGPWTSLGNPVRGTEKQVKTTFGGQSTFILPVAGKKDAFIFMADIWTPKNPIDGKYVWLPIEFEKGKPIVKWYREWDLTFFNK